MSPFSRLRLTLLLIMAGCQRRRLTVRDAMSSVGILMLETKVKVLDDSCDSAESWNDHNRERHLRVRTSAVSSAALSGRC